MDNTNNFNRVCSFCGESIAADLKRCPYCGSLLGLDKANSGADIRDANRVNENIIHKDASSVWKDENSIHKDAGNAWKDVSNIHKDASNVWEDASSIRKDTSNIREDVSNIQKDESKVWEDANSIHKEASNVREDTRNFASKAVPVQKNMNHGAAGYEIKKTAANEGVYKNNTVTQSKKDSTSARVSSMGNGLKVFLVTVSNLLPGIGQLIGVIAGIVFINTEEDKDKQSFGKAILISSITVFFIMMILFGLLAAYFA